VVTLNPVYGHLEPGGRQVQPGGPGAGIVKGGGTRQGDPHPQTAKGQALGPVSIPVAVAESDGDYATARAVRHPRQRRAGRGNGT
jgi:hypothetical protein